MSNCNSSAHFPDTISIGDQRAVLSLCGGSPLAPASGEAAELSLCIMLVKYPLRFISYQGVYYMKIDFTFVHLDDLEARQQLDAFVWSIVAEGLYFCVKGGTDT